MDRIERVAEELTRKLRLTYGIERTPEQVLDSLLAEIDVVGLATGRGLELIEMVDQPHRLPAIRGFVRRMNELNNVVGW